MRTTRTQFDTSTNTRGFSVECNSCLQEFCIEPENIQIETANLEHNGKTETVEIQCFVCPQCGHRYVFFIANDELKSLINEHLEFLKSDRTGMSKNKFELKDRLMREKIQLKMKRLERLYNKQYGAEDNGK